jgi:Uma2 family endonuclease
MAIVGLAREEVSTRDVFHHLPIPSILRVYEAGPEDFEAITDDDLKCEYLDGELIVHSPASFRHEEIAAFLLSLLRAFVTDRRLGWVLGSHAVMQLGERRFCPDVSVLLHAHADRIREERVHGPMDREGDGSLTVRTPVPISTSTRDYDFRTKAPAYREGGIPEIWLVDPDRREFHVPVLQGDTYSQQTLASGEWVSPTLPGFTMRVDWLWRDPLPALRDCQLE